MGSEQRKNVTEQFTTANIFVHSNKQIGLQLSDGYQHRRSQRCYFSLYLLHTIFFKMYFIFDTEYLEKNSILFSKSTLFPIQNLEEITE